MRNAARFSGGVRPKRWPRFNGHRSVVYPPSSESPVTQPGRRLAEKRFFPATSLGSWMKEVRFCELWICPLSTRGTWLHRLAKAAKFQRVVQARGSFLISGRAADRGPRWGRHRAPRALASPHIAPSIFQCREFRITEPETSRNPRCPQN